MAERRAGPEAMQKVFPDIFAWRDRAPQKEAIFFEIARRPPVSGRQFLCQMLRSCLTGREAA